MQQEVYFKKKALTLFMAFQEKQQAEENFKRQIQELSQKYHEAIAARIKARAESDEFMKEQLKVK